MLREIWGKTNLPLNILDLLNDITDFERRVQEASSGEQSFEEYEVKIPSDDEIFGKLHKLGAVYKGAALEKNFLYDDDKGSVDKVLGRLRIRIFEDLYEPSVKAMITVKGKQTSSDGFAKRNFEAELELHDDEALAISKKFTDAGLHMISSYERIRHYIELDNPPCKFDVDYFTDLGRILEIEGNEEAVQKAVTLVGYKMSDSINKPYDTVYNEWRERNNLPEVDFIKFKEDTKVLMAKERKIREIFK